MKKILIISGIITIVLFVFTFTGLFSMDKEAIQALSKGNNQFANESYDEALQSYELGLSKSPNNKSLNYNAGQTAYILGEYEKAIEYFNKSGDEVDKFLNSGNIYFKSGETQEDVNQQIQLYKQALEAYHNGIIIYPQNIPLKFNYEYVKEKLKELLENAEQDNDQKDENQDDEEENSESNENQNSEGNNENNNGDEKSEESDTKNSNNTKDSNEQEGEGSENNENETNEEDKESYSSEDGEYNPDQEAIERILQMLESQEEQSLKNNQEIKGGKEDKNGW